MSGPIATLLTWSGFKAELKSYLMVSTTNHDTALQTIFEAACDYADDYLNRPFENLVPKITVASPSAGDTVTIEGKTYEAAAATDADEREFKIEAADADTAQNLVDLVNSAIVGGSEGAIGVRDVVATRDGTVITLGKRFPRNAAIACTSSDEDTLRVDIYRTSYTAAELPKYVKLWIFGFVAWKFKNRDGRLDERREAGVTGISWGAHPDMHLLNLIDYPEL